MASKKLKRSLSIGIDLGGTKIATGLVDSTGKVLAEDRRPSKAPNHDQISVKKQIEFCVNAMADTAYAVVEQRPGKTFREKLSGICGVGLAAAGPLDVNKGLIVHPANLGDWGIVPIVRLLTAALKKRGLNFKVHFQNDAIAAALGEGWIGRAKGLESYVMITLGTGIGTGVILNGKPAQSRGMGSEWGHHIVDLTAFGDDPVEGWYHSTVEGMASGTGMRKLAKLKGFNGSSTTELAAAARKKDPIALEIFDGASRALASCFYNFSIGFNLQKFVFTGGMLPIQDLFVPQAIEMYKKMIKATAPDFEAPIVVSKLGNEAGVIGAARLPYI